MTSHDSNSPLALQTWAKHKAFSLRSQMLLGKPGPCDSISGAAGPSAMRGDTFTVRTAALNAPLPGPQPNHMGNWIDAVEASASETGSDVATGPPRPLSQTPLVVADDW